jgi:phage FluMu gp28-like protein
VSEVPKHQGQALPAALDGLPRGNLLLGYQQQAFMMLAHFALLVIEKSRRIGLTWGLAAWAVLKGAASRIAGGSDVFYISYSREMTREFIDACAMWAKAFALVAGETSLVGEFVFDDQDEHGNTKQIQAFRIQFASGFQIVALSSAPRSLRGMQGAVIVDEAAFVDNLAELLKAAMALLMWGGQVIVVSTHNGVDNPFNTLLDQIKSGKRKGGYVTITFADAMAQGLYERICLVTGKTPTPEGKIEFERDIRDFYGEDAAEELDCIPKAGAGGYLDPADISACEHEDAGNPEKYEGGLSVIGRDVARRRDLAVIWPFEITKDGHLWLRERYEGKKVKFAEQDAVFERMFKQYHVMRACIDQTGMGEKVVEDLQTAMGSDRIVGVILSPTNRLDVAIALKKRIEAHTIHFPPSPEIRTDLKAIKKAKGTGDTVRLINDDTVHADMFWAAGLACMAAETDPLTCRGFIAVPKTAGKYDIRGDDDGRFRMRADEPVSHGNWGGRGGVW